MLVEAIIVIIAISIVFCCCTLGCYMLFHYLLTEGKPDALPEPEVWEAKHYYDPLSTPTPPDNIFKPTPYTFKLQNGYGLYSTSISTPHAVINPAVLQYPPGHVLDQQRVHPSQPTPAQKRREKETHKDHPPTRRRSTRSRSPSPNPRRAKNVWSTSTEFQQPQFYYQHQHHSRHHYPPQQQQQQHYQERQYVQLTQEHYPIQNIQSSRQPQHIHFPVELEEHHRQAAQSHMQSQQQQQYEPFMASSHATNVYTTNHHHHQQNSHYHHSQYKQNKISKARHKDAVT